MGPIARLLARLSGTAVPASAAGEGAQGEALAQALERYPGFRVLRAINHARHVDQLGLCDAGEQIAVVVDTETTGLDPREDRLIEIAAQRFLFSTDGQIREVDGSEGGPSQRIGQKADVHRCTPSSHRFAGHCRIPFSSCRTRIRASPRSGWAPVRAHRRSSSMVTSTCSP